MGNYVNLPVNLWAKQMTNGKTVIVNKDKSQPKNIVVKDIKNEK